MYKIHVWFLCIYERFKDVKIGAAHIICKDMWNIQSKLHIHKDMNSHKHNLLPSAPLFFQITNSFFF